MNDRGGRFPANGDAKQAPDAPAGPKRRRARSKAVAAPAVAAPQGLPALFERAAQAANFDVEALGKLIALRREIEADAERRAFDQNFAALQAEIGRAQTNAYDPQKRRAYADLNALVDAVGPLAAARGFTITDDTEPSTVPGAVKISMKVIRNGRRSMCRWTERGAPKSPARHIS